jgi:hypothetical protein
MGAGPPGVTTCENLRPDLRFLSFLRFQAFGFECPTRATNRINVETSVTE